MVKYHPNPQIQTEKKEFSNMSAVHIYTEKGKKVICSVWQRFWLATCFRLGEGITKMLMLRFLWKWELSDIKITSKRHRYKTTLDTIRIDRHRHIEVAYSLLITVIKFLHITSESTTNQTALDNSYCLQQQNYKQIYYRYSIYTLPSTERLSVWLVVKYFLYN